MKKETLFDGWNRTLRALAACSTFALLAGGEAEAQVWTSVASACVVDEASLARYEGSGARFRHLGANTGTIDAKCNVANPKDDGTAPDWSFLEVAYSDPDGTETPYGIEVILYQVNQGSGGVQEMGRFNSNTNGPNRTGAEVDGEPLANDSWDFSTHAYYVQIRVTRPAGAIQYPSVSLVRLTSLFI